MNPYKIMFSALKFASLNWKEEMTQKSIKYLAHVSYVAYSSKAITFVLQQGLRVNSKEKHHETIQYS